MTEARALTPATDGDFRWLVHFLPQLETGDPTPDEAQYRTQYQHRFWLFGAPGQEPEACAVLDVLEDTGYVRAIVVDAPARGRGVGGALMAAVASVLRARGCARWCLNVKVDNTPATRLYERWGMTRAYESHALRLPWERAAALPSGSSAVRCRAVEPEDDAEIERRWGLPAGQLRGWRAMAGQHLLGLFEGSERGECVGFGRANPGHPGVFPFRVRDPSLAGALLEGARPLFAQAGPVVNVVVEDDLALAELLLARGAERKMHLAHMRGAIPG